MTYPFSFLILLTNPSADNSVNAGYSTLILCVVILPSAYKKGVMDCYLTIQAIAEKTKGPAMRGLYISIVLFIS